MAASFARPLICPLVVGREDVLGALGHLLEQAGGGSGLTVLVSGEAGVGKSRLVAEASASASRLGFETLLGSCFEPDRTVPYAPLLDLLRTLPEALRTRPDSAADDPAGWRTAAPDQALLERLPEFAPIMPDLAALPASEPGQEKRRLFGALSRFFLRQSERAPLLIAVEDVHWSDETSLEFLLALARQLRNLPVVLLLTYRTEEVEAPLRHLLAGVDRERLAVDLPLHRLTLEDTGRMIRAIFDLHRPVVPSFLEMIYALTDGNPFFVEEVLKSLVVSGEVLYGDVVHSARPMGEVSIPRSVQDAVQRRTERLSAGARRTLALAAVAGRRFDFAVLQSLQGCDEGQLMQWLRDLIAAQLVVEESSERFAFRHALTRQAIQAELLARERRALHGAIAETIERLYQPALGAHLADLAAHYYQAEAWDKALRYARRAGEQAQALYAPSAAVEHFGRAIDAARRLSLVPSPELYRLRGLAHEAAGDIDRARDDHETALAIARSNGSATAEWRALSDLGELWTSREYERAGEYLEAALAMARRMGDREAVGQSLNRLGRCHSYRGKPELALGHHQEALEIFERLGNRQGVAATLELLGMTCQVMADLAASTRYYERAVPIIRELDDRPLLVTALTFLAQRAGVHQASTVVPQAPLDECIADAQEALEIARSIRWPSAEAFAALFLGSLLTARGRFDESLTLLHGGLETSEAIENQPNMVLTQIVLGVAYQELLAYEPARRHFERCTNLARQIGFVTLETSGLACLVSELVGEGRLAEAAATLRTGRTFRAPPPAISLRQLRCAEAELELARGRPRQALAIADELIATTPGRAPGEVVPRLSRLRGEALAAQRRLDAAEAELGAAVQGAAWQGAQPLLWRAHLALGKVHQAQRRRDAAEREFAAGRSIVETLAAGVSDAALRSGFLERALAPFPAPRRPTPLRAARERYGGLTARERQVAALVAQGLTNRQIAARLLISRETAAGHVKQILHKLGFDSRAQVAAWAAERGLATTTEPNAR